jgi:AraC-like DNA-binding protein
MNHPLMLFVVLFLVGAAVIGGIVWYFVRLRKKNASEAAAVRLPSVDFSSDLFETAAIDQFLYDRCCRYMMERRPFLVESFTLQDLANAVYTNKVYLRKTINRFSGRNFKQYVNYYRVMYSMELFRNNTGLRVNEMAELSGFHSTTSFLRSFKQVMGEQPSHWCSRVRRKTIKKI